MTSSSPAGASSSPSATGTDSGSSSSSRALKGRRGGARCPAASSRSWATPATVASPVVATWPRLTFPGCGHSTRGEHLPSGRAHRCGQSGAAAARELDSARQVLSRRRLRLRGQPRGLRDAAPLRRLLPARGRRLFPHRGHEQLHLEPALDVPAPAGAPRLPGVPLPRRLGRRAGRRRRSRAPRPGDRHRARDALELRGQQALELPTTTRRLAVAAVLALALAAPAAAAQTAPVYDSEGNVIGTPFVPEKPKPALTEERAIQIAVADPKVADWLDRYPAESLTREAELEEGSWEIKVWSDLPDAGQVALAKVDDATGRVTEAWTGPQVAWKMARGYDGAFGRKINEPWIWLPLCAVFLIGLADLRRPLSVRNLDLLVLLSFSISLWFFNRGDVFTAMPLAYPPLLYLLARMGWIGWRGRGSPVRSLWPVWLLLAVTVVGLAGVIGAQRIVEDGEMPYGNMPDDTGAECGPADADGYVRERIQTNGRCEVANGRGDTYGPVSYLAYVPGVVTMGWSGKWDYLPAAHFTSILWDALALLGMGALGFRFGGARLGATLAFAWAAYPFPQYVSSSNSNDAIMPALLVWGFWLLSSPPGRGALLALAAWAKFAAFLLVPLWASY